VPRETPYSAIHLENMLKLARLGVAIIDASEQYYDVSKQQNCDADIIQ
jgi:4-hydroxy-3-polyprenylbenzoate decarboxylase